MSTPRKKVAPSVIRARLTIPETDETVLAWMEQQYRLSESFRTLVRDWVARYGYQDATSLPVGQTAQPQVTASVQQAPAPRRSARLASDQAVSQSQSRPELSGSQNRAEAASDPVPEVSASPSEAQPRRDDDPVPDPAVGLADPETEDSDVLGMDAIFGG